MRCRVHVMSALRVVAVAALAVVMVGGVALPGAAKPNTKDDRKLGPEGEHPVYVVMCSPVYCGGIWIPRREAKRAGIPPCSATVTNFCYR